MNADQIFTKWKQGGYKSIVEVHQECKKDPQLLGAVILKIKNHQNGNTSEVSGESNTTTTPTPGTSDTKKSEGIQGERCCQGQTRCKSENSTEKQTRQEVSREARVSGDRPEEGEIYVSGYGCGCHSRKRRCGVLIFW